MKKDSSELILEWSEKIRRQKLSNKSVATWCKDEGISSNTFQYWNKKIKKQSTAIAKKRFSRNTRRPAH